MTEKHTKFFSDNGLNPPWWAETESAPHMLSFDIPDDDEDLSLEVEAEQNQPNVGSQENQEPEKPKKKFNIFKALAYLIVSIFTTKIDLGQKSGKTLKKRVIEDYADIPEKRIEFLNSASLSVRPAEETQDKLRNLNTFFLYWRSRMFIDDNVDVDFPSDTMYIAYKRALILDRNKGCLNIYRPTLESLAAAVNELTILDFNVSTFNSIAELMDEMHKRQIALVEMNDGAVAVVYGIFADCTYLYMDGEFKNLSRNEFDCRFRKGLEASRK